MKTIGNTVHAVKKVLFALSATVIVSLTSCDSISSITPDEQGIAQSNREVADTLVPGPVFVKPPVITDDGWRVKADTLASGPVSLKPPVITDDGW